MLSFLFYFCCCAETNDHDTIIGIDLGTTYSCVGIYQNGKVDIIANEIGNRITPSVVYIGEGKTLVGEAALPYLVTDPENTIYAIKRLIGRSFSEEVVQKEIEILHYNVVNHNGIPYVAIPVQKSDPENNKPKQIQEFSPEEISALILKKMKETAEAYLGYTVSKAVVTVPAYFSDRQRRATLDAGKIAGLTISRIINEPTAASLAYGLDKSVEESTTILVYDLGGGTFDVTLLNIEDTFFEVLATGGDTHLGGEDFDNRIVDHFADIFERKTGKNIRKDQRAMAKLKRECEKAKRVLSSEHQATIEIDNLFEGESLNEILTRARFDEINMDLFRKTIEPITQVLDDANILKHEVDVIVLVGGSTRIPKVQQLVKEYFNGKSLCKSINPDEAVAYGASVQGAVLNEQVSILVHNVNPLTLGIETVGGLMKEVIPRNTHIPVKRTRTFSNAEDDDDMVTIQIYEGERPLTRDNHFLGSFDLSGLPPGPKGTVLFEVQFEIDQNGILTVSATEESTGSHQSLTISVSDNRLDDDELQQAIDNAESNEEEDEKLRAGIEAKNNFDVVISRALYKLQRTTKITDEKREELENLLNEEKEWLQNQDDNDIDLINERFEKLGEHVSFLFDEKDEEEMLYYEV